MENIERLEKQLTFIKEIDKLKYIQRKTKLYNSDRLENDAEHSWHLAIMVLVLSEHADFEVNLFKVVKMVLVHDIVEIDAGDTFLYDTTKNHVNTEEELLAAERIFGLLPEDQKKEFLSLWKEFEEGETNEAKFAKSIDRFAPILQNESNDGGTWAEYSVSYEKVHEKVKGISKGSSTIWDYTLNILNQSRKKGWMGN